MPNHCPEVSDRLDEDIRLMGMHRCFGVPTLKFGFIKRKLVILWTRKRGRDLCDSASNKRIRAGDYGKRLASGKGQRVGLRVTVILHGPFSVAVSCSRAAMISK